MMIRNIIKFFFSSLFFFLIFSPAYSSNFGIEKSFIESSSKHICNVLIGKSNLNDEWYKINNRVRELSHKNKDFRVISNIFQRGNKINLITLTFESKRPFIQLRLDKKCNFQNIRLVQYKQNTPNKILTINRNFKDILKKEDLNPPLPSNLKKTNNNLIALVDTGVNYTLKKLKNNIAINNEGKLLGYDFWDEDEFPFDNDPRRNPFYPRHHGTTIFSVLKNEAPDIKTAIYRFPALQICKFKNLIEEISKNSLKVVNLSMGSSNKKDWECFMSAAKKHSNLIFVVSAGNNKQNIDIKPIYPASFDLKNIITVSSSTKNGQLGRDSNYGFKNVDFLLPAERVLVLDHRGVKAFTGGTSYAVPRMVALISRYMLKHKHSSLDEVLNFLKKRAISNNNKFSKYGWIPDPTDNYLIN